MNRNTELTEGEREGLAPLPTPPASSEQATSTLRSVLLFLLIAAGGGVVGYGLATLLGGDEAPAAEGAAEAPAAWEVGGWDLLYILPGLVLVLLVVLAVHEAGHLIGGRLAGFRFLIFIVGPLRVQRTGQGIEVGFNRAAALAGGLAGSTPPDPYADDLERRTVLLVAGGPVMSVLSALVGIGAYYALDADTWTSANATKAAVMAANALGFFGVASAGIALAALIPARTSGFYTDGARLLRLWRGGPSAERDEAVVRLGQAMMSTTRPRDWPAAWIDAACSQDDDSLFDAMGHQMAYYSALDSGAVDAAVAHLHHALEAYGQLPGLVQHNLALEAAFVEGALRSDAAAARAWYEQAEDGPFIEQTTVLRAEAAVLMAEGAAEAAAAHIHEAEALTGASLYPGQARAERDWLHVVKTPADRTE